MKKIILLVLILIGNFSFSQTPYKISENLKNGGTNGQYSFRVNGEISFGKPVVGSNNNFPGVPKIHYPVIFRNIKIISITTPNGKTYSNNDLVYKTNSQYYPNGIKLPISLSNSQAQKHFKINGSVNFNGTKTPFVKSLANNSYSKENEFWLDNAGFKYVINSQIEDKLEKSGQLKGLKTREKHNLVIKKLKEILYSNGTTPKITEVIFEPYADGNKNLGNLMKLASDTEFIEERESTNSNSSNKSSNNNNYNPSNSNTSNSNSNSLDTKNQETKEEKAKRLDKEKGEEILKKGQEDIDRIKQKSDEIGNEVANMFQNGVTPQGFYNMSQSFYGLNTESGVIAGGLSSLAGIGLDFANALKAERQENITINLNSIENNSKKLNKEYKKLEKSASNNNFKSMLNINDNINIIESTMMYNFFWLSKKGRKNNRENFKKGYDNLLQNYKKRIALFQQLETNLLLKKIILEQLYEEKIILEFLKLSHKEFLITVNTAQNLKYFKYLKKVNDNYFILELSSHLNNGWKKRIDTIIENLKKAKYKNLKYYLYLLDNSNGSEIQECYRCDENENEFMLNLSDFFKNLEYEKQKFLLEQILYRTVPSLEYKKKMKYKENYIYKGCFYSMSIINSLLSEMFELDLNILIYSRYQKKEIPLHNAILERNDKISSIKIIKKNIKRRLEMEK